MILAVIMIIGIMPKVEAQAATTPAKVTEEQVKQRMEVFKKMVDDGAYFTYDGTPCAYASGHGCDKCSTDMLIKSDHIKNYLGLLPESIYRLPNNTKQSRSCMSCRAFVLIAHWYLYAQKSTDTVEVSVIKGLDNVKLSNGNMLDSNGKPVFRIGDIIETSGHSAVISDYYKDSSGNVTGFYVIDCNNNGDVVGNCKVQEWKYTSFGRFYNIWGSARVYRATNYSAHVHDYSGDNNVGYCNSCKNDYLTTSEFSSSKVYTSGTVTPKTTAQLHIKMRPYAASTWTNGDANIKADSATMEYTCKNHWGNTWYCVKFKDNSGSYKTGYVYNGDVNFVKDPNTVNASCFLASKFGGKINEGDSLWVSKSEYGGSVKSTDGTTWITKVVFGIYNTNGSLTSSKNEVTKRNINATSYTISSSDDTILFSSLSQGNYVFKITGYDVTGKSGSASFNFTVVKSGATTYTISYNANGGSGAPSSQTKIKDTTLTLSTQKPTRGGYTFLGWATSSSATTAQYQPGGSYTSNANATLYAVWKAQTYTVSYDANGGTGAPSSQTKTHGTTLTLSTQKPTRSGHTFLGWATSSSAPTAQYQPGGSYTSNSSVTLYAVWKAQTYTVSYDANGGSGAPSSQTKTYGVTLRLSMQEPTRSGYIFTGWATSSSATSAQYQPGGSYTSNANATLYAVWKVQTYTITYDNNGGRWIFDFNNDEDENGQIKKTAKVGESVELDSNGASPIRDNGELCLQWGWSTKKLTPYNSWYSGMPEPEYRYGDIYSGNKDITLYAVWIEAYGIMYYSNGGTFDYYGDTCRIGASPVSYKGKTMTIGEIISNIVRDGYTFLGWSTDPNATTAQYQNGDVYNKNVDIDLYAVWQKNAPVTYTVSYNANGGSGAPAAQTKTHDVALKLSTQQPTRDGYTFLGWATSSSATSAQYQPGEYFDIDEDTTLYAVWKNTYTITYDANGGLICLEGVGGDSRYYDEEVNKGESAIIGKGIDKIIREGYTFRGWATYPGAPNAKYQNGDIYDEDTDIELYAIWESNTYTITYYSNGGVMCPEGVGGAHTEYDDRGNKGESIVIGKVIIEITRDGYTFLGWSTDPNATTAQYQNGDIYNKDKDIYLFAVWKKQNTNVPTITVATVNGSAGKEVTVGISIENNPGIAGMTFALDYDKTRIELVGYEDSGMKGWTIGVENAGASWAEIADYTDNGEILKLKFRVLDNAADGMAHIRIIELKTFNSDEKEVKTVASSGSVNVINRFPGDINDDGKVDIRDAIRLAKYLAKENVEINLSNANVNGDDKVDVRDLIRLKKYLAKMPVTLV